MRLPTLVLPGLTLLLAHAPLAGVTDAEARRGSTADAAAYSQRETASRGLASFAGGAASDPAPPRATAADETSYALRERAAPELERFAGGNAGVALTIFLVVAFLVLVAILVPW